MAAPISSIQHIPMPLLSIVVLAYNRQTFIEETLSSLDAALESLAPPHLQRIEKIIYDNGSTTPVARGCKDSSVIGLFAI